MRDIALAGVLVFLLAMAVARPFVGVLVWSWISFMNPHREAFGFAQTMPWAMLAFVATVFGCILAREPRKFSLNWVTGLLLLLGLCVTVTSYTALGPPESVWLKWNRTFKSLIGLLLTAQLLTTRWRIHALIWLIVISLGFYGVKGGIFTVNSGGAYIVLGPPDSMIGDRNHLSTALLFAIPLMNYLRQHSRHRVTRIGLVAAMVCTLFAVVGSQSRGALVGLAATAVMLWLRSNGKIVSGIAICLGIAAAVMFMPDSWMERMNTIQDYQEDGSAMGRITIWRVALQLALMRPLVGAGFEGMYRQNIVNMVDPTVQSRATHSIWLEVLGEHGFPTFFVWLGAMIAGAVYSLRITKLARGRDDLRWAYDLSRMSQVSMVAYAVGGSFLSLSYWDCFWTLMVVIAATHALVTQAVAKSDNSRAAVSFLTRSTKDSLARPERPRPAHP
jgi:putative inorganic carbon (HCO3(-)) transporter